MSTKRKKSIVWGNLMGKNNFRMGSVWGRDAKLKNVWLPKEGEKKK